MRNNAVERKRWASVRSYLCGDEFNSVLAEEDHQSSKSALNSIFLEDYSVSARTSKATVFSSRIDEDSASIKSSEATVTQPINLEAQEKTDLTSKHDAAMVIQSAFRGFLVISLTKILVFLIFHVQKLTFLESFQARRRKEQLEYTNINDLEVVVPLGSPSKESIATSVEVQTGNSVVEFNEGSASFTHRKGVRVQASKLKQDDWDDSTVSSNISKMRIQNRLEASTRRERALAYAFSQQLRICSKKKQNAKSGNGPEANMSWSWLERWMATRQHDTSFGDISKQFEQLNRNQKLMVKRRVLSDLAGEEKESCGSNEVSMHFNNVSLSSKTSEKDYYKPTRNRLKATSVSRQKTSPSYHFSKVNKQGGHEKEVMCDDDAVSHVSPEHEIKSESNKM